MIDEMTGEPKTMRVPLWMMKVASGMLLVLSIGATASILVFFAWLVWLTALLGGNIKETKKLRSELHNVNKQASSQREEVVKGIEEVKKAITEGPMGEKK
jgi:hypothetical protein